MVLQTSKDIYAFVVDRLSFKYNNSAPTASNFASVHVCVVLQLELSWFLCTINLFLRRSEDTALFILKEVYQEPNAELIKS